MPRLARSEEHTSELQSQFHIVCRLLLEKKKSAPRAPYVEHPEILGPVAQLLHLWDFVSGLLKLVASNGTRWAPVAPDELFFLVLRRPPRPTLFPYTTLFRSAGTGRPRRARANRAPPSRRDRPWARARDRKSTRLNSSHSSISYAVFCLKT